MMTSCKDPRKHKALSRRRRQYIPFVLIIVMVLTSPASAVDVSESRDSPSMVWAQMWRHATTDEIIDAAVGDTTGNGVLDLAVLMPQSVVVYELMDDGPVFIDVLGLPPEEVTALATAPTGPGHPASLWLGTASPGLVYVYTFDEQLGQFIPTDRIRFAWGDIKHIVPLDLDGADGTDVAILTQQGDLSLFRWTPGGYQKLFMDGVVRDVRSIAKGSLGSSTRDVLIVARGSDQILILSWDPRRDKIETIWENFIWGQHSALMIGPFSGGDQTEIAVATTQRLLHRFVAGDFEDLQQAAPPTAWPSYSEQHLASGYFAGDDKAVAAFAAENGFVLWELEPVISPVSTVSTSIHPIKNIFGSAHDRQLVIVGIDGFAHLHWIPSSYIEVIVKGAREPLAQPAHFVGDIPYMSADDWHRFTGVTLTWDTETGRIRGGRGLRFVLGQVGEEEWFVNGLSRSASPAVLVDDVLYLHPDFGGLVGIKASWDRLARTIIIE